MQRLLYGLVGMTILSFLLPACGNKNDNAPPATDPGVFAANIDGAVWKPTTHRVVYFTKWHQISFMASDNSWRFYCGVNLNPAGSTDNYVIQSNGDNMVTLTNDIVAYATIGNVSDVGGYITITKFDTVQKKMSATMHVVGYSLDRSKRSVFNSTEITDMPIDIDTSAYDGNFAQCTFTGAQTTTWHSKDIATRISCTVTAGTTVYKVLSIAMYSIIGTNGTRRLVFNIPLQRLPGDHPITLDYFDGCDEGKIFAKYGYYYDVDTYNPTSGTLKILSIDTVAKTLHAGFNLNVKDTLWHETIQITNGDMQIRW